MGSGVAGTGAAGLPHGAAVAATQVTCGRSEYSCEVAAVRAESTAITARFEAFRSMRRPLPAATICFTESAASV